MTSPLKPLAVAALCAATVLAGCGGNDETPTATPTPTPGFVDTPAPTGPSPADAKGATATEKWAKTVCDGLAGSTKALQPPTVQGTSPKETKASLENFFTQLAEQLGNQEKALKEAGPPPGPNGKKVYAKAIAKLSKVQSKVEGVAARTKSADVKSADDVQKLVADLGKSLAVMSGYDGPIAQLIETRPVGAALKAEPACASLAVAGQTTQ